MPEHDEMIAALTELRAAHNHWLGNCGIVDSVEYSYHLHTHRDLARFTVAWRLDAVAERHRQLDSAPIQRAGSAWDPQ